MYLMAIMVLAMWCGISVALFLAGKNPKTSILISSSRFRRKDAPNRFKKVDRIFRVVLINSSIACFGFFALPVVIDIMEMAVQGGYPERVCVASKFDAGVGAIGLVVRYVDFEDCGVWHGKLFFSPARKIVVGHSYRIVVLPRSGVIGSIQDVN